MICPQCKTEYRPGFTHCVDCDVDLVWELPKNAIEMRSVGADGRYRMPGGPGDPNEDPFCSFWKGDDPRVHAELCTVLDEAGIPHNTVYRRDHLFNLRNYAAFEIGVPFSMYERAENAVKEAYEGVDKADVESLGLKGFLMERGELLGELPEKLTPSDSENVPGPPSAGGESDWYPEEATVKVWSAEQGGSSDFLAAALHENGIFCRIESDNSRAELYVLPKDEGRAREIVREVVEGRPPEYGDSFA